MFVIDEVDRNLAPEVRALGMDAVVLDTIMNDEADKVALASGVLNAVGYANVR